MCTFQSVKKHGCRYRWGQGGRGVWARAYIKSLLSRYLVSSFHINGTHNNGLVLILKTILLQWNCFLSSVATNGKDGNGLKLEKLANFQLNFSSTENLGGIAGVTETRREFQSLKWLARYIVYLLEWPSFLGHGIITTLMIACEQALPLKDSLYPCEESFQNNCPTTCNTTSIITSGHHVE